MPLSFIGAMMFGGAFLNSYLSDKAFVEAHRKSLHEGLILIKPFIRKQVEYIRPEIWNLYAEFRSQLTPDTIVPDMILVTNFDGKDNIYPQTSTMQQRYGSDGSLTISDPYSYYHWWSKIYNNHQVKIFPEMSSEEEAIQVAGDMVVTELKKLHEEGIFITDYYSGTIFRYDYYFTGDYKSTKELIRNLKVQTDYHPPRESDSNIESAYHDYHFRHPIKSAKYITHSKNPLHKKQIRHIRKHIIRATLLPIKAWEDRLIYEYKGAVPPHFVTIDYFLRWCYRQGIEITTQEQQAFFNCHIVDENTINYGDIFCDAFNVRSDLDEVYNQLIKAADAYEYNYGDPDDIWVVLENNDEIFSSAYFGSIFKDRTGMELLGSLVGDAETVKRKGDLKIPYSQLRRQQIAQQELEKLRESQKLNNISSKSQPKQSFWQKLFGK